MDEIEAVMKDFNTLMKAEKKEVLAVVTTAVPLKPGDVSAIKDALSGFVKPGETLQMEMVVKKSILGGMVVTLGDKSIDLSAARTFNELQRVMQAPVV